MKESYLPIEDYGVIGNLNTVALVGRDGSIDFCCLPDFDSPSVFVALLDRRIGGHFQIAPKESGDPRTKQLYLPGTNILLTRFLSEQCVVEVTDFMPIRNGEALGNQIVRIVRVVRGEATLQMICHPAFDYARAGHRIDLDGNGALFTQEQGDGALHLRASVPLAQGPNGEVTAEFRLGYEGCATFVLSQPTPGEPELLPTRAAIEESLAETRTFWKQWAARSTYDGRWREFVERSALVLKLLTSRKHGSIVAAPTFSLPESLGGTRNWDYRYTWIRDASFTLYALIRLGYTEETTAFMQWVEARAEEVRDENGLKILYTLSGKPFAAEEELDHLEGYKGSRPVRIGNGAVDQLQLDIYGELMDAIYLYDKYGQEVHYDLWRRISQLTEWVCKNWNRPDSGIWEPRGDKAHYLYSRVLCWVAIDRALRLSRKRSLPCPAEAWRAVRDDIYLDVMNNFFDKDRKAFVQFRGGKEMDASTLIMPLVRFISPHDPRWLSTIQAIEKDLADDTLVYRYHRNNPLDPIPEHEGYFTMCSFWYVECLARSGQIDRAQLYFEKMLSYSNHLGLYAEELGTSGEHLGNFPQCFTHLALISAAYALDRGVDGGRPNESTS